MKTLEITKSYEFEIEPKINEYSYDDYGKGGGNLEFKVLDIVSSNNNSTVFKVNAKSIQCDVDLGDIYLDKLQIDAIHLITVKTNLLKDATREDEVEGKILKSDLVSYEFKSDKKIKHDTLRKELDDCYNFDLSDMEIVVWVKN